MAVEPGAAEGRAKARTMRTGGPEGTTASVRHRHTPQRRNGFRTNTITNQTQTWRKEANFLSVRRMNGLRANGLAAKRKNESRTSILAAKRG